MSNAAISFPLIGLTMNPDRVMFSLFGRSFYWYGAIIAVGCALAMIYTLRRTKDFGVPQERFIDMLLCAVPTAIVFARLYYVIFEFETFAGDPLKILRVWEGGLAIYGGVIGAVLAVFIYCRVVKLPVGPMLDLGGLGLLIGQGIGRWGNLINREVYGTVTDLPWKMGLTAASGTTVYVHPTFLYESLWNALGFVLLHFFSKKRRKYDGQLFILYVAWYGLGRAFIEGIRTDYLLLWGTNIRVSQLLAIVSCLAAVIVLFYNRVFKTHEPEDMLVNKVKPAAAAGEEPIEACRGEQCSPEGTEADSMIDEDGTDTGEEYEPVTEPIEVTFRDDGEAMEDGGNS